MPRYEVTTDQELAPDRRSRLAAEITQAHAELTGTSGVHVVFHVLGTGNSFVDSQARPDTFVQGSIRQGHGDETLVKLMAQLTDAVSRLSGVDTADVVIALREVPGGRVMEGGKVLA